MDGIQIAVDSLIVSCSWKPEGSSGKESILGLSADYQAGMNSAASICQLVMRNLVEACLSAEERQDALKSDKELQIAAAEEIRVVEGKGKASELAEICLYGVLREYYKCMPCCSKIFYKQNTQDPAKGADSVHFRKEYDGNISYWYGEAKFYTKFDTSNMAIILSSVAEIFDARKYKKENQLILNYRDLEYTINDVALYEVVKGDLRRELDATIAKSIHVPIMVIFERAECDSDEEFTRDISVVANELKDKARSYYELHVKKFKEMLSFYNEIHFHLILFPVSKKSDIADWFNAYISGLVSGATSE